jgi:hypothetical protein
MLSLLLAALLAMLEAVVGTLGARVPVRVLRAACNRRRRGRDLHLRDRAPTPPVRQSHWANPGSFWMVSMALKSAFIARSA